MSTADGRLSHVNEEGEAVMVDVSGKAVTKRFARAEGFIKVNAAVWQALTEKTAAKGDVFGAARIAGSMAAKECPRLIPLCHSLGLDSCAVDFTLNEKDSGNSRSIRAESSVRCTGVTGVEIEALAAVSVALLTVYDMCKALDKGMEITGIRLLEKSGGRSGHYKAFDVK